MTFSSPGGLSPSHPLLCPRWPSCSPPCSLYFRGCLTSLLKALGLGLLCILLAGLIQQGNGQIQEGLLKWGSGAILLGTFAGGFFARVFAAPGLSAGRAELPCCLLHLPLLPLTSSHPILPIQEHPCLHPDQLRALCTVPAPEPLKDKRQSSA